MTFTTRRAAIVLIASLTLGALAADGALARHANRPHGVAPKVTAKLGGDETDGVAPKRAPVRRTVKPGKASVKLAGDETDGVAPKRPANGAAANGGKRPVNGAAANGGKRTAKLGGEEHDGVAPKRSARLAGDETDGVAPRRTAKP